MQVGEFVEVSNNSDTDPCAWVGVVDKLGKTVRVRVCRPCANSMHCKIPAMSVASLACNHLNIA